MSEPMQGKTDLGTPRKKKKGKKQGTRPEMHGNYYRLRIEGFKPNGTVGRIYRTCGTDSDVVADEIADKVLELRKSGGEKGRKLLQRVFEGNLSLPKMMTVLEEQNKVESLNGRLVKLAVADIAERALDSVTALSLAQLVDQWDDGTRAPWMVRRLRSVIPADCPHRIDWFTAGNLSRLLNDLQPRRPHCKALKFKAKRQYRVALSNFATMLVELRLIGANPTYGTSIIIKKTDADKKPLDADGNEIIFYYTEEQVRQLIAALADNPVVQMMVALCFATGAEFMAVCRMKKETLENRRARLIRVMGSKNENRKWRLCEVWQDWLWDIIERYYDSLKPGEWLVPRAKLRTRVAQEDGPNPPDHQLRNALKAACAATNVPYLAFHRFRHSLAVHWILAGALEGRVEGMNEAWLQQQLGHKSGSAELRRTYGKFIIEARTVIGALKRAKDREENMRHAAAAAEMAQAEQDELAERRARRARPASVKGYRPIRLGLGQRKA